ncbi:MAG TPA: type VI secretion system baseplate subunit TssF [Gemmataceae bacterium]|nr:type VI secretion system baseplate subunit TssF [Gemmataceae bacterium]
MSEVLFPYYERELTFIRQLSQDFARHYPAAAGRLLLESHRSADPHVERLIESFALLAARVHRKLDDEFPELTDALLSILYPHLLTFIPSMAIVQFDLDPERLSQPTGFRIDRHTRLYTRADGTTYRFRTAYPVMLWPIQLTNAELLSPPFPPELKPPPNTQAVLRLQLETLSGARFADLPLDRLRFYLAGESQFVANLYELLFNHTLQVVFRHPGAEPDPSSFSLSAEQCLGQVGFERDEGLLPYGSQSFLGYRLLSEFFAFPNKFLFVDLGGFSRLHRTWQGSRLEVVLFLDETQASLQRGVDARTFRLGCTPIVNLFEQTAEPIALTHARSEYRVVPDVGDPAGVEVYSVDSVASVDPTSGTTTEYQPFYSYRHGQDRKSQQAFWYASRRASLRAERGTEVYLNLVDLQFDPRRPAEATVIVRTTCANGNVADRLQRFGDRIPFELEAAAPLSRIRCLRPPTAPLYRHAEHGGYWRLISQLSLNHLSLTDPVNGRAALQEILRLYDLANPEEEQRLAAIMRNLIDGITAVSSRRVVGRTGSPTASGFCRGLEVTVEFDEEKYIGTGAFLFASVLERFLALYTSINSFTQMVAKIKQQEGYLKRWPPRSGEQQLL